MDYNEGWNDGKMRNFDERIFYPLRAFCAMSRYSKRHRETRRGSVECPLCDVKFAQISAMKAHIYAWMSPNREDGAISGDFWALLCAADKEAPGDKPRKRVIRKRKDNQSGWKQIIAYAESETFCARVDETSEIVGNVERLNDKDTIQGEISGNARNVGA